MKLYTTSAPEKKWKKKEWLLHNLTSYYPIPFMGLVICSKKTKCQPILTPMDRAK
jgi:hypothetical protein